MTSNTVSPSVQPEVHKFLEAVYAVAPHPEEYMKYRLHLATTLPLDFLESWFERRRAASKEQDQSASRHLTAAAMHAMDKEGNLSKHSHGQGFSLFGGTAPTPSSHSIEQRSLALLASTTREVQDVGRLLRMVQNNSWDRARPSSEDTSNALEACKATDTTANETSVRSCGTEGSAAPSNRFTEADLGVISQLVGLETINSKESHCGSHSLYMFEQLTALDSLDFDSSGSKRKRTRHQHFWRNTDKLDPRDRVYVPTASLPPALKNDQPVVPKKEISPDERTNSWTVCLTTSGVIGYLNKRISPLGVQMIRTLAANCRPQKQRPRIPSLPPHSKSESLHHDGNGPGFRRIKPKPSPGRPDIPPPNRSKSPSNSDGVSISDGGKSDRAEENFHVPAPRTRRRKPM